eukprot:1238170-Rhodomonas_salina.1
MSGGRCCFLPMITAGEEWSTASSTVSCLSAGIASRRMMGLPPSFHLNPSVASHQSRSGGASSTLGPTNTLNPPCLE